MLAELFSLNLSASSPGEQVKRAYSLNLLVIFLANNNLFNFKSNSCH